MDLLPLAAEACAASLRKAATAPEQRLYIHPQITSTKLQPLTAFLAIVHHYHQVVAFKYMGVL